MANLLKSSAAFRERAQECGLTGAEVRTIEGQGVTTLASLAYAVCAPGTAATETALRSLLNSASPDAVTLGSLAAIRQLHFESQTLSVAQVKAAIESGGEGEKRHDLVPAERQVRIDEQKTRVQGLDIRGPLECSYASYAYVASMLDGGTPLWLEPSRFTPRSQEVQREKPGKELVLDASSSRVTVRDRHDRDKCAIMTELDLSLIHI